jgi:geranylgeranyl diphosphate synthase type I
MDIKEELGKLKKEVDQELDIFLKKVIEDTEKIDKFLATVLQHCKDNLLADGKRVRPAMMHYGYLAGGGNQKKEIIKASMSVELIHFFLLMHDDIIDKDDLRHNQETIHSRYKKYSQKFFLAKDDKHFGISVAIVLGDMFYALGNRVLFQSNFEAEFIIKALDKLQKVVGQTGIGEIEDVVMEYEGVASENKILSMYENKTARYTFEGPLHLGAILAGADDEFCDKLSEFAIPLGVAFQIQDDMLGVFGDEKKTGKPVGSDVTEGKITLLTLKAYEKADGGQKKILDNLLGKEDLTKKELVIFQDILIKTGALEEAQKFAFQLLTEAKQKIKLAKLPLETEEFLIGLADYLDKREV